MGWTTNGVGSGAATKPSLGAAGMMEPGTEMQPALDQPAPVPTDAEPLRLLFVSDECCLCEALAKALEDDLSVSAVRCADPAETVALSLVAQADAVLVHGALQDGPDAVRQLREIAPTIPVIACLLRESTEIVVAWAAAGITGYLPNTVRLGEFVSNLRKILSGEQFSSGRVVAGLLRRIAIAASHGRENAPSSTWRLTRRERQIAALIAAGLGDKDIALQLNIRLATVKSHVHNLFGKLKVESRVHVADALRGRRPGSSG